MIVSLVYVLGTVLSWAGWICLGLALFRLVDLTALPKGVARSRSSGAAARLSAAGAICLIMAMSLPMNDGQPAVATTFWRFPLVWIVAPFTAWAGAACFVYAVVTLLMVWIEVKSRVVADPAVKLRARRIRDSLVALAAAVAFGYFFWQSHDQVEVFRGGIGMKPTTVGLIVVLAAAAVALMAFAGRATRSRGVSKAVATQIALLVGCVVFGLPFLWAIVTSFKEDQDMSSANGLVWIPKVSETVPYRDPDNPLYQGTFLGRTVQARLIEREPSGKLKLDVQRPLVYRGRTLEADETQLTVIDDQAPVVTGDYDGRQVTGFVIKDLDNGLRRVKITQPATYKDVTFDSEPAKLAAVRHVGLRWQNYPDSLEYLPPESNSGLVYFKNTMILVVLNILGTLLSSSLVAYAFARLRFPAKGVIFTILLSTMMLPAAVTLLPQFLIFRSFGWIDTLLPLWVPALFANAYFVFMLRQFFMSLPAELEDAGKIDGCTHLRTYWSIMLPQIKPALTVVSIWTFMSVWSNFQQPLVYINSPEKMPVTYALQLYNGDRFGEPGLLMAFSVMTIVPVLILFFIAQRYFIEGATLSGLGGR